MRILFTFAGGSGHFEPLAPVARACAAAGQASMLPVVEKAGFATFNTGGETINSTPKRRPLLEVDMQREERDLAEGFAGRVARH